MSLYNLDETILVTVAIPTYNRALYLKDTLSSIVNQTYKNLDILISDNCSNDNTEEIVSSFSDSRIRYVKHKTNTGLNRNYQYCINQSIGEYIMITSDDDILLSNCIEKLMLGFRMNKSIVLSTSNHSYIDSNGNEINKPTNHCSGILESNDLLIQKILTRRLEATNGSIYKTRLLKSIKNLNDVGYACDLIFELYAAQNGNIYVDGNVLLKYRLHQNSLSQNQTPNNRLKVWSSSYRYLFDNHDLKINYQLLDKYIISHHIYQIGMDAALLKDYETIISAIELLKAKGDNIKSLILFVLSKPTGLKTYKLLKNIKNTCRLIKHTLLNHIYN